MMGKKKRKPNEVKQRSFQLVLYPDNKQHMKALHYIFRHMSAYYAGIWHTLRDDSGAEIVRGEGKKHCHIVLNFLNGRYWSAVADELGLDWSLEIGSRFLRPVGYDKRFDDEGRKYNLQSALIYLTHRNAVEKEQYSVRDVFGCARLVSKCVEEVLKCEARSVSLAGALTVCRRWVQAQRDTIITPSMFVDWISSTPYIAYCQNRWIEKMIDYHNWQIRCDFVSSETSKFAQSYGSYGREGISFSVNDSPNCQEMTDSEFQEVLKSWGVV